MKVIAKTHPGREFAYITRSARKVSERSAEKILAIVNACKWDLKDGEIWHLYDVDKYDTGYDYAQYQSFTIRNGVVTARG